MNIMNLAMELLHLEGTCTEKHPVRFVSLGPTGAGIPSGGLPKVADQANMFDHVCIFVSRSDYAVKFLRMGQVFQTNAIDFDEFWSKNQA